MKNQEVDELAQVIFEAFRELTHKQGRAGVMSTPWDFLSDEEKEPSRYIAEKVIEYYDTTTPR